MASIKKINERKFKITVCNGYRPNGQKIARAKTITVPKSVQARSIMQYVHHTAEEFEREVKLGFSEFGEMTFEEYALKWLERHGSSQAVGSSRTPARTSSKYAVSTINGYRKLLEKCYPHIGSIKLNRLKPIALENMLNEIRKRTYKGRVIKEVTVQKHLVAVSAVLSDAKRNEIIQRNPAHMLDLPIPEKSEQVIPTDSQIVEFMNYLLELPEHFRYYYFLAIYTGCRRGELCGFKWSDFNVLEGKYTLIVSRSRSSLPYSGVVEKGTKNNKDRHILLSQDIWDIVLNYYHYKKNQCGELGIKMSEYLFTDDNGNMIHPDTFSKNIRKVFDKLGFSKSFHLHTLRHYFVSTMLHNGVDKQTVAELAGHGDTSFLERTYCHPHTISKQKAAVSMHNILFGGTAYIDEDGKEQPIRTA